MLEGVGPRNRTNEPANSPSRLRRNTGTACDLGIVGLQAIPVECGRCHLAAKEEEPRAQAGGKNEASQNAADAVV